jgi:formylglycine-generating enzyme
MRFTTAVVFSMSLCATSVHADTFGSGANLFDIEFVTIADPGNPDDTDYNDSILDGITTFGSVNYVYRIAKFETSERMIDVANALGNLRITKATRGPDKPATVSWWPAARFVNWLNTSSGSFPAYKFGSTGGFELWQPSDAGYDPNNLFRNSRAKYFLPSSDEWYKAAYYDPTNEVYYDYPTGSDSRPDGIDFPGDPDFDAVLSDGGSIGVYPRDITDVGALSPYGTAGQGGNAWEWEETEFDQLNDSLTTFRMYRSGFLPWNWAVSENGAAGPYVGFRVASIAIPEPTSMLLAVGGMLILAGRNKRKGVV